MKCDIPTEVGANILWVARAEHRERLDEADLASDDGDQGLQGHEDDDDTDHVIVEAGEATCCATEDRSDNTDTLSLYPVYSRAVHNGKLGGLNNDNSALWTLARWGASQVPGVYSKWSSLINRDQSLCKLLRIDLLWFDVGKYIKMFGPKIPHTFHCFHVDPETNLSNRNARQQVNWPMRVQV